MARLHLSLNSIAAFASLVLTGCEVAPTGDAAIGAATASNSLASAAECYTDHFQQPEGQFTRKLDLLFVVDTSGSMTQEKKKLVAGVDAFVKALPVNSDIQIGVMLAHGSTSKYSGRLYRASAEPAVLSNQQLSMLQIQTMLDYKLTHTRTDILAGGGEEGLYSLWKLFSDAGRFGEARTQNFLRLDAAFAVVFLSDENDVCAVYPQGVKRVSDPTYLETLAYYKDCVKPEFKLVNNTSKDDHDDDSCKKDSHGDYRDQKNRLVKQIGWKTVVSPEIVYNKIKSVWGDRPLVIGAVAYNNLATVVKSGQNEYGYGYLDLVKLAGGVSVDLAGTDYSSGLRSIGELTRTQMILNSEFQLSHDKIDASTILATVDGGKVDHSFDAILNRVTLTDELGQGGSLVDVNYCLQIPVVIPPTDPGTIDPVDPTPTPDPIPEGTDPGNPADPNPPCTALTCDGGVGI